MKRQCPSGKNKNIINLLSAELAQRVVKVMGNGYTFKRDNSCQNHFYLAYRKRGYSKRERTLSKSFLPPL